MFFSSDDFEGAIQSFEQAEALLPLPKYNWEISTEVYAALGDAYYLLDRHQEAQNCFFEALKCNGAVDNPFINLRIGQTSFNLGYEKLAQEYLLRA